MLPSKEAKLVLGNALFLFLHNCNLLNIFLWSIAHRTGVIVSTLIVGFKSMSYCRKALLNASPGVSVGSYAL